jgi:alpha-N-acetylglucosaminidase
MGCIDGVCGPLPNRWIDSHLALGKKIVARERELGMKPVLQGFTGHVPGALKTVFPNVKLGSPTRWLGYPDTYFVDPHDPLFAKIGKAFIEEQSRQFGTDHLYASDTFIEMTPKDGSPEFLAAFSKSIYEAMRAGDPDSVWIMQGWMFIFNQKFWTMPRIRAMLGAVPDDRLLVLDLCCETKPAWNLTESFCGKPWLWCVVQEWGGRTMLHGQLPIMMARLLEARTSPKHGQVKGIGMVQEGLGYNPVVIDLIFETAWREELPDLPKWIHDYAQSRYGTCPRGADEAWQLLLATCYTYGPRGSCVVQLPGLKNVPGPRSIAPPLYDSRQLALAWQKLLGCADTLGTVDTYRYDLVQIGRQVLANLAFEIRAQAVTAYERHDRKALAEAEGRFVQLLRDMDDLLATREEFLLGRWLEDAKRWGTNDEERRFYEWNARNLITTWGLRWQGPHEYAYRQWSGMLAGFYLTRWQRFFAALDKSLAEGTPFDAKTFTESSRDWELKWAHQTETHPATPRNDSVEISCRLWKKYNRYFTHSVPGKNSHPDSKLSNGY